VRDIPMSDKDKWAIYEDLLHVNTREDYPSPNITVKEYADRYGLKPVTAANRLEALWEKGLMKKATYVKIGSHTCNVYWAASLESEDTHTASDG